MVQWLRLHASTTERWVQFLIGELRSHMLCSTAKNLKTKQSNSVSVTCNYEYFNYLLLLLIIITVFSKARSQNTAPCLRGSQEGCSLYKEGWSVYFFLCSIPIGLSSSPAPSRTPGLSISKSKDDPLLLLHLDLFLFCVLNSG